jgi:hypothetical protein
MPNKMGYGNKNGTKTGNGKNGTKNGNGKKPAKKK